eukprot:1161775-Rhodomonas_salina.2
MAWSGGKGSINLSSRTCGGWSGLFSAVNLAAHDGACQDRAGQDMGLQCEFAGEKRVWSTIGRRTRY